MDNESTLTIDSYGNKIWKNKEGELHRLDGPAIEFFDGGKEWYQNGELHKLDGPAIIYPDGYMSWYIKNKCHREDGPAIIYHDNSKSWCLEDKPYKTKEEWFNALSDEAKIRCLFSEDFLNG